MSSSQSRSSRGPIHAAKALLLAAFVIAGFGGGLAWSIKTLDHQQASWEPQLPARITNITCRDHAYTCATVVVTAPDGHQYTFAEQVFIGKIVAGQGLRAWFRYHQPSHVFIENAESNNEFHSRPFPGWFSKLALAIGVALAGLLLGLGVLRARKVDREPWARGWPFKAMSVAAGWGPEEVHVSVLSMLQFVGAIGIVLLLALTKAGTEDLDIVNGVTALDLLYGIGLLWGVVNLYKWLVRRVPWLGWTWTEAADDDTGYGKLGVKRFSWLYTIYGVILFSFWPLLAQDEEQFFRGGTHGWVAALWRSFWWGFIYCLIGAPLAFGLAMIAGGLVFTEIYFSGGGLHQAIEVHAVYNAVGLGAFGVGIAYELWSKRRRAARRSAPAT